MERAIELGLSGICFTEHEQLGNSIEIDSLQKEYKEQYPDFKIAHGNEIYLTDTRDKNQRYYHFILIALDAVGFHMLTELSSTAWLNGYYDRGMMRVPTLKSEIEEIIERCGQGHLYASTACLGSELDALILDMLEAEQIDNYLGRKEAHDKIVEFVLWCMNTFGKENFTLEIQPGLSEEQLAVNKTMIELSRVFGVPLCITSDAHFLRQEDRDIHRAFLNSKEGEREVDSFYQYCWLHSDEEMAAALKDLDVDYQELVQNSLNIMRRIEDYSITRPQEVPQAPVPAFPKEDDAAHRFDATKYPTLDKLSHSDNEQERAWINLCYDGLQNKGLVNETYLARLEEEADTQETIGNKLDTCIVAYPLFLRHYINLVWECGSTVGCGRGSAGGGLSHWLLGITQTDPLKTGSYFWRFLNKSRTELPKQYWAV